MYYSDIADNYKRILPDENKIVNKIRTEIPDLEYSSLSYLPKIKGYAQILVYYNIRKNTEEAYNLQYYGNVDLYVLKVIKDEELNINISAIIFYNSISFIMNNPTSELIKTEITQSVNSLITALKAKYYQDNYNEK